MDHCNCPRIGIYLENICCIYMQGSLDFVLLLDPCDWISECLVCSIYIHICMFIICIYICMYRLKPVFIYSHAIIVQSSSFTLN